MDSAGRIDSAKEITTRASPAPTNATKVRELGGRFSHPIEASTLRGGELCPGAPLLAGDTNQVRHIDRHEVPT